MLTISGYRVKRTDTTYPGVTVVLPSEVDAFLGTPTPTRTRLQYLRELKRAGTLVCSQLGVLQSWIHQGGRFFRAYVFVGPPEGIPRLPRPRRRARRWC